MKATRTDVPLWELRGIYKRFPGVQALENVSMTIREGQIHALVGENGCGKSTLVKCLSGAHQAEEGDLIYRGEIVEIPHPFVARDYGVATIYQEFSLVPTLTVAENIFLGRQPRQSQLTGIDWKEMRSRTAEILEQLSIDIDPESTVRNLSVAEQQLVEIVKAISADASLLIMDEPTAALGLSESQRLHELIKRFAQDGQAILYISHRLDDVFQIADHITVLKDGRLVGDKPAGEFQPREVISLMVGFDIAQHYPKEANVGNEICLEVRNMSTEAGVRDISFDVRRGEVFGLGGMVGSKRTAVALGLFGVDRLTAGEIFLEGKKVSFSSPSQAIKAGVGLIPENRKEDGLLFNFEAPQNITLSRLSGLLRGVFLSLQEEQRVGREYVNKLNISAGAMTRSVKFLSGGNQQKVVIAKWLYSNAKLLIFDEPTQGVDIGAKVEVYQVINELTANGISVLLISSDFPELLAMSDRVAIVRDGQILQVVSARELTEFQLMAISSGAE